MARAEAPPPRVYADTCLFFDVVRERDDWRTSLKLLTAAEDGRVVLFASTLVKAEVIGFFGDMPTAKQDEIVDRYLDESLIEWTELDLFIVRDARVLARKHRMRGGDAVHLATAVRRDCDYLMSRDSDFPYGQKIGPTRVTKPTVVWAENLIDLAIDDQE